MVSMVDQKARLFAPGTCFMLSLVSAEIALCGRRSSVTYFMRRFSLKPLYRQEVYLSNYID